MTGNPSGTATATVVRRGGKEAVCKALAGRTETAYEALMRSDPEWNTMGKRAKLRKPNSHPERGDVYGAS